MLICSCIFIDGVLHFQNFSCIVFWNLFNYLSEHPYHSSSDILSFSFSLQSFTKALVVGVILLPGSCLQVTTCLPDVQRMAFVVKGFSLKMCSSSWCYVVPVSSAVIDGSGSGCVLHSAQSQHGWPGSLGAPTSKARTLRS